MGTHICGGASRLPSVKTVRRHDDPAKVILHSTNPDYDDIEVLRSDIESLYPVENVINYDLLD